MFLRSVSRSMVSVLLVLLSGCGGGSSQDTRLADALDGFIKPYMAANGITATTLAVMKNGQILYEKSYGYQDLAGTTPLRSNALMTGASIVKPVTAAAIQALASAGSLLLSDKVFCPDVATSPSPSHHCWLSKSLWSAADSRIANITIAHLLAHQGGWNRAGTACYAYQNPSTDNSKTAAIQLVLQASGTPCDPLQHEFIVQDQLGLISPTLTQPTLEQDISFFMRGSLDYDPGTTPPAGMDQYSNFGYVLLGYIIEKVSGQTYNNYVNSTILAPLGISAADFQDSHSLIANADPREPNYITTVIAPSIFVPGTLVSARNGALNAGNFVAAATSMMTAKAMALFASFYKIDTNANSVDGINNGKPLAGVPNSGFHYGDLPGTAAVVSQSTSGISYAVLMNRNDKYEGAGASTGCGSCGGNAGPLQNTSIAVRVGINAAIATAGY